MGHPYWPLFDLRLRTPRLELRPADDGDLLRLAAAATDGIHDPDFMPFLTAWTRASSPQLERNILQWNWRCRAEWAPTSWHLSFAVVHEGEVIGNQSLMAKDFATLRHVSSGSWLGRAWQGQGFGKEMRSAVLHFAFAGLGAEFAATEAFAGNEASLGVTRALGYEPNGVHQRLVEDQRREELMYVLTRERWSERQRDDITIENLAPCLEMFGLDAAAPPQVD